MNDVAKRLRGGLPGVSGMVAAESYNTQGIAHQRAGDLEMATECFRAAISLNPKTPASTNLGVLLMELGQSSASLQYLQRGALGNPSLVATIAGWARVALAQGDLSRAARYASIHANLKWGVGGSVTVDGSLNGRNAPIDLEITDLKLRHDIEQMQYIKGKGECPPQVCDDVISLYRETLARMDRESSSRKQIRSLPGRLSMDIENVFNRILHVRHAPRVIQAMSRTWSRRVAQREYASSRLGVVVIDNFLSQDGLALLRRFCNESTIWSTNRYAHGRLGSFFVDGFNTPLIIQIAEELREALPELLGALPLRQIWGYKYPAVMPGDGVHADFAAINVNLWITENSANVDDATGGLRIFECKAPPEWSFERYNRDGGAIRDFLARRNAKAIDVPYRENRAIIFDSNLFHATAAVAFGRSYWQRRINVTFLFGDR